MLYQIFTLFNDDARRNENRYCSFFTDESSHSFCSVSALLSLLVFEIVMNEIEFLFDSASGSKTIIFTSVTQSWIFTAT